MTHDKIELFVPGRLCLFGEHSDWAGQLRKFNSGIVPGQALVACTNEGIFATARRCGTLKLRTVTPEGSIINFEHTFDAAQLKKIASEGGYFSYIAGVAAYIATFYDIGGIELDCHTVTLPQKKGLSSSAAVCVLTARAFNRLYGLNLTVRGEMEAAYSGEQLTPSRCGRLDQACAYGKGIVHMRFDGDALDVRPVKVGAPLHLVFADLNAKKDTITILRDLNSAYPYPRTPEDHALHNLLGKQNEKTINSAVSAISGGSSQKIGELMREAQENFDRYAAPLSPQELKSEKLHAVLGDPALKKWIFGGKGVGSQGDGSVQFIAKDEKCALRLKKYLSDTHGLDCFTITIPKTHPVRKAVIPVAGYGTRMYPATKIIKKEFFPVVDFDGYVKPALLVIINELISAGIEEICLIIRSGEEDLYLSLFKKLQDSGAGNLPSHLAAYERDLSKIRDKITFVYQEQMLGFGHAVLQSAGFADNEPVLLMLGDHIYHSGENLNCTGQMLAAYEKMERPIIGLFEIEPKDAPKYGLVKGELCEKPFAKLTELTEKPSEDYAKANLGINGKQYAIFMYVLTPEIYGALSKQFSDGKTELGEFQLTPALDAVAKKSGVYGAIIDGERFDLGAPEEYRKTVTKFGR